MGKNLFTVENGKITSNNLPLSTGNTNKSLFSVDNGKITSNTNLPSTIKKVQPKNKKWYEKFFKESDAFNDGYQFGDISQSLVSSIGDIATGVGKGFMNTVEGVADAAQYGISDVLDLVGLEKAAKAVKKNANFNSTGALFGENKEENDNLFSKGWADRLDKKSFIGETSDTVNQGIGNVAAMAGLGYLTGGTSTSSFVSSFASAYGNTRSKAYADGMDDDTARKAATINGFAEAISEQFFDGFNIKGLKTEGWGSKLVGKIGSGVEKYFGTNAGKIVMKLLDASGEGAEEIISNMLVSTGNDIIHAIDKNYNYGMENQTGNIFKDIKSDLTSNETWDAFISATLTSALINGGNAIITQSQKESLVKAYAKDNNITVNEAKKQFNQAVAKVSNSNLDENSNFHDRIESEENAQKYLVRESRGKNFNLNNYINDGDTQNQSINVNKDNFQNKEAIAPITVKELVEKENSAKNEPNKQILPINYDLINNSNIQNKSNLLPMRNLNLVESAKTYNIDPSSEAITSINKMLSDRGINARFDANLFNDSNANAIWMTNKNESGATVREVIFNPNADTKQLIQDVAIHELYHDMVAGGNADLVTDLIESFNMRFPDFQKAREELAKTYSKAYQNSANFEQAIDEEVVANILGQKLGSQEYTNRLVHEKPTIAKQIYNFVIDKLNKLNRLVGYKSEKIFWEDVKNKFEKAYREEYRNNLREANIKISLSKNALQDVTSIATETREQAENNSNQFAKLKDNTIKPLVDFGIEDLPMLERRGHVRENILTEEQAQKLGFSTKNKHFHGLGVKAYLEIIDSMDNPIAVYQYTDKGKYSSDNFIVVTPFEIDGHKSIVPVEVNKRGQYNQVEIDFNKIKSNYLETKQDYLKKMVQEGKIKEIFTQSSAEQTSLDKTNIPQSDKNVKSDISIKYSIPVNQNNTQELKDSSFSYRGSHQIENAKKVTDLDLNNLQERVIEVNGGLSKQDYSDLNKLKKILNSPNETVKIYRASPVNELNSGDWVTTDKAYAKNVAEQNGGKVYEYEVKANQLFYPDDVKELPSLHRLSSFQYNDSVSNEFDNQGRKLSEEQQNYFKDSKVRDENGNLEVVYHGSEKAGFTKFNRNFNFYTNNKNVAKSYTGSNEMVDTRKLESVFDAKTWLKGIDDNLYIEGNDVYSYVDGDKILSYNTKEELLQHLKRDIQIEIGNTEAGGIYEGYANIIKPLVVNANGDKWSGIDINGIEIDNAKELLKKYGSSTFMEKSVIRTSTSDIVSAIYEAIDNGELNYDGVIFKNIIDEGMFESGAKGETTSNVYVTFNSNQFKSVDNLEPTEDADIRYSQGNSKWQEYLDKHYKKEGTGNLLSDLKTIEEKAQEVVSDNKNLTDEEAQEMYVLENMPFELDQKESERLEYLKNKEKGYKAKFPELKKNITYNDIKSEYSKYRDLTGFDSKTLNTAKQFVPGYRNTEKRTKQQWLSIANFIGSNLKTDSSEELTKYAIQSWFSTKPNTKDTLNRQGKKYVKFSIDDWVNEVYEGAGVGKLVKENNILPVKASINTNAEETKQIVPVDSINKKDTDSNVTPILPTRKVETGKGESNFASNIEYKTNMLSETSKDSILSSDEVNYYKQVSNQESLEEAQYRLNKGGQSETFNWLTKDNSKATSVDVAEGWILLKQYQDAVEKETDAIKKDELNRSMVEVAKKMREMGTKAGQTVQAFNILNRLTPEGMVYYAQSELSEAYDKMSKNKTREWIDDNRERFELTPEETQFILDNMKKIQGMKDGYDKRVKLAEIQKVMTDKLPPGKGSKIKSWMRLSMLFNPKTQVRNVVGNAAIAPVNYFGDLFSSYADKIIAKKTGVRTTGNINVKAILKGMKQGAYEATNDYRKGINTKDMEGNRFEIGDGKSFDDKKMIGRALNRTESLLNYVMDVGDRIFSQASFENSLQNQMILNNTTEVTQDMIDIARAESLQRTWNDNNAYTSFVLNTRKGLNKINIHGYGLGDILIPFAKTPANLTKAIVDYSPVGLVNAIVEGNNLKKSLMNGQYTSQMQHRFVQDLGKATAGTMLYVLAYALAKAGKISGKSDDDKDTANFLKNTLGISSYSIKIGDKSFTYDWAQPIAAPLSIMSNIVSSKNNKGQALMEGIVGSLDTAGSILLEQSFLQSINSVLTDNDGFVSGLVNAVLDLPARAIPTFSKQIADMVDGTQRTSFEYGKPLETAANKIKAKIPFVSRSLAPSVDTMGREIQKYGGKNNIFNVFLNPANVNTENVSGSAKEIYRLYKSTGETDIMPRVAPYYVNQSGEKINMDSNQRAKYQKVSGSIIERNIKELLTNSKYKNMNDTEKADIINKIVNYSYNKAKSEVFNIPMSDNYKKIDSYVKENGSVANYYLNKEEIDYSYNYPEKYKLIKQITTYDKYLTYQDNIDEVKKVYSNTNQRKNAVISYVNSLDMSIVQKAMLIKMNYSSFNQYNKQIIEYVNNQSLTIDEKSAILTKLGFKVKDGRVY